MAMNIHFGHLTMECEVTCHEGRRRIYLARQFWSSLLENPKIFEYCMPPIFTGCSPKKFQEEPVAYVPRVNSVRPGDFFTFNRKRAQASNRYSPCPQHQHIPLVSTGTSHRVILPVDMSLATSEIQLLSSSSLCMSLVTEPDSASWKISSSSSESH